VGNNITNYQKILPKDATVTELGGTVAIGGNYMLANAICNTSQDCVFFYVYDTTSKIWSCTYQLIDNNNFGISVDMSDYGLAVIGDTSAAPGSVSIYQVNPSLTWDFKGMITECPSLCPLYFNFGLQVDIADEYLFVAATDRVYLYSYQGASFKGINEITIPQVISDDYFHFAIDLEGTFGAIGAPNHNVNGAAYPVFVQCSSGAYYGANCDQTCTCSTCNSSLSALRTCPPLPSNQNLAVIIGAVVGGVVGLLMIIVIVVIIYKYVISRAPTTQLQ